MKTSAEHLAQLMQEHLEGFLRFKPSLPRVFLAYVQENQEAANRLCENLEDAGFAPWLDQRSLLPGQKWPPTIEEAIETSEFFIACFSTFSVGKKGFFQTEIRDALACAKRFPLEETFLIPARLDSCRVPWTIRREMQYIDLFPDWELGVKRILAVMHDQLRKRR